MSQISVFRVIGTLCDISWPSSFISLPTDLHFLPKLKTLSSRCCFGPCSSLLKTIPRPSLTHLSLYCSHFGIPESITGQVKTWQDVPDLFPNLQLLSLNRADGLTLEKLLEIVPRLASLRHLELPKDLLNSEEQQQLKGELNNRRPSPISFRFANPKGMDIYNKNCYYLVDENEGAEEEGMEGIVEDDQDM